MDFLKYCWLVIRLVITNAIFVFQILFSKISKFSLISIFYVLILLQGLLITGVFIQQKKLNSYQTIQQELDNKIQQELQLDSLETQQIVDFYATQEKLEEFLQQHLIALESHPSHRDLLVNTAILELKHNFNEEKYNQLIEKAKKTDPNWTGWKK